MHAKRLVVASIAAAGALFAGASQAHTDWHVSIGLPPLLLPPLPGVTIRAEPRVVYEQPRVVYEEPRAYYPAPRAYPAPPVYYPAPRGYYQAPRPAYWDRGDRDHDGIPNRYDRVDNRRFDRDGDGVPNRHDRHDDRRGDRDGGRGPDRDDRGDRQHHW